MQCAACGAPMIVVEYQGVELDWCPECGGIWFDNEELDFLLQGAGVDSSALEFSAAARGEARRAGEHTRRCPRCSRRMAKRTVGHGHTVILDQCPRHGLWFDKGELAAMLQASVPQQDWKRVAGFLGAVFPGEGKNKEAES